MEVVSLDAPVHGDRFLKMFWTVQRITPVAACYNFKNRWTCIQAYGYLTRQFMHRGRLRVTQQPDQTSLLLEYVELSDLKQQAG